MGDGKAKGGSGHLAAIRAPPGGWLTTAAGAAGVEAPPACIFHLLPETGNTRRGVPKAGERQRTPGK